MNDIAKRDFAGRQGVRLIDQDCLPRTAPNHSISGRVPGIVELLPVAEPVDRRKLCLSFEVGLPVAGDDTAKGAS
jgi:hypothetical protein